MPAALLSARAFFMPSERNGSVAESDNLNAQQLRFALSVIEGKPGGKAYVDAGYKARGNAADVNASKLLRNPKVAAFIEKMRGQMQQDTKVTAERVILELARIAFADHRNYATVTARGVTLKPSDSLTADQAAAVSEVSETPTRHGRAIKFKLYDKLPALQMLGKHLGIFDVTDRSDKTLMEQMHEALMQDAEGYSGDRPE